MQNEMNNKDYIEILIQSLGKKVRVLDGILAKNVEQSQIISADKPDFEKFDRLYEEKESLIKYI